MWEYRILEDRVMAGQRTAVEGMEMAAAGGGLFQAQSGPASEPGVGEGAHGGGGGRRPGY